MHKGRYSREYARVNIRNVYDGHIAKFPNIKVSFSHRLVNVRQSDSELKVLFMTTEGEKFLTADYFASCDDAGSAVRHCLRILCEVELSFMVMLHTSTSLAALISGQTILLED